MQDANEPTSIDSALSSFLEFYRQYNGLIYFLVLQYVPGEEFAEDMMQDVLLRLMENWHTLRDVADSQEKTAAYIARTVRSVWVDGYRSMDIRKKLIVLTTDADKLEPHREPPGLNAALARLHARELREQLPERDWQLLWGKYIMGYSNEELAVKIGCAPDSVRMALSRAKKRARELLGGD